MIVQHVLTSTTRGMMVMVAAVVLWQAASQCRGEEPVPASGPVTEIVTPIRDEIPTYMPEGMLRPFIDAHTHWGGQHPQALAWLARYDAKLLLIGSGRRGELSRSLIQKYPKRYAWCTSFGLKGFELPGYAEKVIEGLRKDFANGAIACKIFKSLGLFLKDSKGNLPQIDDPIFEPILRWMEQEGHVLMAHVGEPMGMWRPLGETNAYTIYLKKRPRGHFYGRDDVPSHATIMAARDRVLARHPKLKMIGAHFGSMEYDVAEIAKRFDAYGNFAVDTSGPTRIIDLGQQDHEKVRAFFIKYADRIMYGSDRSSRKSQLEMNAEELAVSLGEIEWAAQISWDYYATDKVVVIKGFKCKGLSLPPDVLKKLFYTTAKTWLPGM